MQRLKEDRDLAAGNIEKDEQTYQNENFAPVAKTGQITPYCPGDDGALQQGVGVGAPLPNPRFTDNEDGTVTDNLTGLIWLKNANCANGTADWETAFDWVDELNEKGTMNDENAGDISNGETHQTDWQLPNVKELQSLIHYGFYDPALPNTAGTGKWTEGDPFDRVQPKYYWSSSTRSSSTGLAWAVYLFDGGVDASGKTHDRYVWPVRCGQ